MATLSFGRPLLIGWRDRVFSPVVKRTYTPFPLAVVAANFRDCVDPSCKLSVFPFKFVSGDHSAITHRHPKPCFDSASNHSSNEPTTRFITISLSEPKAQNVLLSLQDHNMCFFNSSLMNTYIEQDGADKTSNRSLHLFDRSLYETNWQLAGQIKDDFIQG
jgi:hypothetical protein